jgi:hypothetical protein
MRTLQIVRTKNIVCDSARLETGVLRGRRKRSLDHRLALAPQVQPRYDQVATMVSVGDLADRAPHPTVDGERPTLGRHQIQWFDTPDVPHVPHGWDAGC